MRQNLAPNSIKFAKPAVDGKPFKLTDGGGLYLMISPKGKYWRYNYRYNGKHKTLALGVYPDVSLKDARDSHSNAKSLLKTGIDPSYVKKQSKLNQRTVHANSFEAVAREWFTEFKSTWVADHAKTIMSRMERDVFPLIGDRPISEIEPPEVLAVMHRVKDRGALETAHRIRSICGQVFRYAVATGRAPRDQTADLKGAFPSPRQRRLAAIKTPKELKKLLLSIDAYEGTFVVKSALKLSSLVMLRPGELRHGKWSEINFETATWTIPIARMKTRKTTKELNESNHIVPLSTQALTILRELHPFTSNFEFIFTGARNRKELLSNLVFKPLNQAAIWSALVTSIPSLNFTPSITFAS